jgi:hypothetical protein
MTSQLVGGTPAEEPYKKIICSNLNLMVGAPGHEDAAHTYWTHDVKRELKLQFSVLPSLSLCVCACGAYADTECTTDASERGGDGADG